MGYAERMDPYLRKAANEESATPVSGHMKN
jgi:hypothetical protein